MRACGDVLSSAGVHAVSKPTARGVRGRAAGLRAGRRRGQRGEPLSLHRRGGELHARDVREPVGPQLQRVSAVRRSHRPRPHITDGETQALKSSYLLFA